MATKSKHRKNHKQKVEARNKRLAEQKRKNEKFQREFIMNLIKQEQEKGLFDNSQSISQDGSSPILDGPILDGPILDGPMLNSIDLDGPILDTPVETVDVVEVQESEDNSGKTNED